MKKTLLIIAAAAAICAMDALANAPKAVKDCPDCPEMIMIPEGSFQMGSQRAAADGAAIVPWEFEELPRHLVHVKAFALGQFEVTQAQWQAIMGNNPSEHQGPSLPVENISWEDAQEFVVKLSAKTGKPYRLPTEAEWEYAARAGSVTQYAFGDDPSELDHYGWHEKNADGKSHPVGLKKPNPFGLFDMHGNVWERIADCWHIDYDEAPTDGSAWDGTDCERRVVRGGSWRNLPQFHRAAYRFRYSPTSVYDFVGLRIARSN